MTATTTSAPGAAAPATGAGTAFGGIMTSAIGVVSDKVDAWSSKLDGLAGGAPPAGAVDGVADDLAEDGGARQQAGVRGVQAGLEGRNPVWAAIKGAWAGGSTLVRAAVVAAGLALLLMLVLSPVLLLAFLLSALVIAAVTRVRSAGK